MTNLLFYSKFREKSWPRLLAPLDKGSLFDRTPEMQNNYYLKHAIIPQQQHPYQIINPSAIPFFLAMSLFINVLNLVWFGLNQDTTNSKFSAFWCLSMFLVFLFTLWWWWSNMIFESNIGLHTKAVVRNIFTGMKLFILTEIMFFISFFFVFFASAFSPSPVLGTRWPPIGIIPIDPWGVPLVNTLLLLSSAAALSLVHAVLTLDPIERQSMFKYDLKVYFSRYSLYSSDDIDGIISNIAYKNWYNTITKYCKTTLILAVIFTILQGLEYSVASFSISDTIYGSVFYMITGAHGAHVIIGSLFIAVCFARHLILKDTTSKRHTGFICAAWYWHFVDVVWIFVYIFLYVWNR